MSWVLDQQELHITVGLVPPAMTQGEAKKVDLLYDVQMVKAALLYGDHARLCSFGSSSFFGITQMTNVPRSKRIQFLQEAVSWPFVNQATKEGLNKLLGEYEFGRRRKHSKRGQLILQEIGARLDQNWDMARQHAEDEISQAGGQGIVDAVNSGLLDVHTFSSFLRQTGVSSEDMLALLMEYLDVLGAAVSDAKSIPLFDEITSDLISSRIAEGKIPVSKTKIGRGKEVALATDLFSRLPLFPKATVKEVLDIRNELAKPLRRFRSAMIKFSQKIHQAPWDDDFAAAAETVFRKEIEPSILSLEEQVGSNRFLSELTSRLVPVGAAAISTLAVSMSNLPAAAIAALTVMGTVIGAATVSQAYGQWAKDKQATGQNELYFYYKAGQLLADGSYEYVDDKTI